MVILRCFRMSFRDFSTWVKRLEICNLTTDNTGGLSWNSNCVHGSWRKKVNAGGCRNYPGMYLVMDGNFLQWGCISFTLFVDLSRILCWILCNRPAKKKHPFVGNANIFLKKYTNIPECWRWWFHDILAK